MIPVDEIVAITQQFEQQIAEQLHREFTACYQSLIDDGSVSAAAVAVRALKGMCLHYLAKINELENNQLLISAANSHNMTNVLAALSAVVKADSSLASELLNQFDSQWRHDVLVMDKWFALQAMQGADNAIANIEKLYQHPCFDFSNPNRVRALIGSFSHFNTAQFHRKDGAGYQLLGDLLVKLNAINPQNASRMLTPFMSWRRYDEVRSVAMKTQLQRLAELDNLSDDLFEKVDKALH